MVGFYVGLLCFAFVLCLAASLPGSNVFVNVVVFIVPFVVQFVVVVVVVVVIRMAVRFHWLRLSRL